LTTYPAPGYFPSRHNLVKQLGLSNQQDHATRLWLMQLMKS